MGSTQFSNRIIWSALAFIIWSFAGSGFSQEEKLDTLETKVDTLLKGQKIMLQKQDKILKEVTYVNPLTGKSFGIEFNPVYPLFSGINGSMFLSGGFSLFSVNRHAERDCLSHFLPEPA